MSEKEVKLTKKQLKAQEFKKTKDDREQDKEQKRKHAEEPVSTEAEADEPVKKKRKTRRGRGGKGRNGEKKGNRFIVFVGSLPKDITNAELQAHFKSSAPDHIRMRADKGIAFLEFDADKDKKNIQRRMDVALLQHRTLIKDKPINVELTVGGGGNSADRLEKLKNKNLKLDDERRERVKKMVEDGTQKKAANSTAAQKPAQNAGPSQAMHPDRARLVQ